MATINENQLTNKTFTPRHDLDYKFFHCENSSKGCNQLLGRGGGGEVSPVFFYLFKMLQHHTNISVQ